MILAAVKATGLDAAVVSELGCITALKEEQTTAVTAFFFGGIDVLALLVASFRKSFVDNAVHCCLEQDCDANQGFSSPIKSLEVTCGKKSDWSSEKKITLQFGVLFIFLLALFAGCHIKSCE